MKPHGLHTVITAPREKDNRPADSKRLHFVVSDLQTASGRQTQLGASATRVPEPAHTVKSQSWHGNKHRGHDEPRNL